MDELLKEYDEARQLARDTLVKVKDAGLNDEINAIENYIRIAAELINNQLIKINSLEGRLDNLLSEESINDQILMIVENSAPSLYGKKGGKQKQYVEYAKLAKKTVDTVELDDLSKRGAKARLVRRVNRYAENDRIPPPSPRHAEGIVGELVDKKLKKS